jgi:integrase
MLEVLYACGLRVTELVSLTLEQVNLRQGVLRVMGKGSKERLVPMGEEAIVWVERYMRDGRGELLGGRPSDVLFPSQRGEQMTRQTFWHRIKHQAKVADRQALSPHIAPRFRHAPAQPRRRPARGADAAGHSDLSTTQIYTHVAGAPAGLHAKHHPRDEKRQFILPRAALRPNCGRLCRFAKGTPRPVFPRGVLPVPLSAFRSSHALTQIFAAAAIALVSTFAVADDAAEQSHP